MDGYAPPDEGYSEDPINPLSTAASFELKGSTPSQGMGGRSHDQQMAWFVERMSSLSTSDKTDLAMALLNDLPTSVIAEIVQQLNPRLYIDFVRYLPPEICLKILGFLDPLSLLHVARSCRQWYELALDRKLWQHLYYFEGWGANVDEMKLAEQQMNEYGFTNLGQALHSVSEDDGHARKKRAISMPDRPSRDMDVIMEDSVTTDEPASFGASASLFGNGSLSLPGRTDGESSATRSQASRSKQRQTNSPSPLRTVPEEWRPSVGLRSQLAPTTLWSQGGPNDQMRLNWKYLYSLRRRLESNWEMGKFRNFQLPHPDFLDEGHHECIYSLQFNSKYLVSGSRDKTLKIWNMATRRLIRTLKRHRASVLCLQFDSDPEEDIVVSGSSDSDVIIWRFSTGEVVQTLSHAHRESVLNVRFDKRILVTCSKDKTIKIFNRREMHPGDLGYQEFQTAARQVINMADEPPLVIPALSMIGCLEGHGAAVNAVQIHEREVVSASGDRHIKVWDWPTQVCMHTIVGHNKGIACVQYDGRRIVSGSSDDEVKVFDRQTCLEVASLRAHTSLVRTVQVGFGDLPNSIEDDAAEAKRVDREYFKALQSGQVQEPRQGERRTREERRLGNAGSKRPEDITAYGAKLPPGGGGGKYGRIVSGSYDTTIIIWRRDKEGIWRPQHHLRQEDAASAALQRSSRTSSTGTTILHPAAQPETRSTGASTASGSGSSTGGHTVRVTSAIATLARQDSLGGPSRTTSQSAPPVPEASSSSQNLQLDASGLPTLTPSAIQSYRQMIDIAVADSPATLAHTVASYPNVLTQRDYISVAIDREPSPFVRSQLRQVVSTAAIRLQFEQARQRREALRAMEEASASGTNRSIPVTRIEALLDPTPSSQPSFSSTTTATATHTSTGNVPVLGQGSSAPAGSSTDQQTVIDPAIPATPTLVHQNLHSTNPVAAGTVAPAQQAARPPPVPPAARRDTSASARVFKLQYDARRIICCSQSNVIVGWDFCNGDAELEQASRFFAPVE